MKYKIDNNIYEVEIIRKNNKNTYVRVKDGKIVVTTSFLTTKLTITKILDDNVSFLKKALYKDLKKQEKNDRFYYLGKCYGVVFKPSICVEISDYKIYANDSNSLDKWLKNQTLTIFKERLNYWYDNFLEDIPYPNLKIRKMTSRWGVCNRKNNNVTLNSELIKYDISKIDYVIIHELSHFVHFNHSKEFWLVVGKYCPDYKKIRKELND